MRSVPVSRLATLMRAIYRRGLKPDTSMDTVRCARLAAPATAEADLRSIGCSATFTCAGSSWATDDLIQLLNHIYVQIFGRPPTARADRYSKGLNAYYGGGCQETAEKEIGHYVATRFSIDDPTHVRFTFDVFDIEFFGPCRDLCGLETAFPELVHKKAKELCQAVGARLSRRPDTKGLKVPSARHRQAQTHLPNLVGYDPDVLTPLQVRGVVHFDLRHDRRGRLQAPKRTFVARL